jgi:hypothetical protein
MGKQLTPISPEEQEAQAAQQSHWWSEGLANVAARHPVLPSSRLQRG